MATSKHNISVTGGNNYIFIGDNPTVNNPGPQEQRRKEDTVISSPKVSVNNCHDPVYTYYPRNKLDHEMQKIRKGKVKTLYGPIGTGKTSAALHFIDVNKERFGIRWFIDVSTDEDNMVASLTDLAQRLGVSYHQLFQTIKKEAENKDVIFLLDNVEKKPSFEWFKELWNIRCSVYIIITTNNSSLPLQISDAEEVLVDKFDEAMEFLEGIPAGNCERNLEDLCNHFGWNILGLTAAKHYMMTTKTTVGVYLEMLDDKEAAGKVRETELRSHEQTLYTGVRACLELINDDGFSAVSITSLISNNMIPEFILSNQLSSSNRLAKMADLNNLHEQLKSLVHITEEHGSRFFSFHAFTQYVIRDMIDESTKSELLYKLAGLFVRYFNKDNRFSKDDFLQRKMREHAEVFLREWGDKDKDTRTMIALARLSELVGFAYTQQQPPLQHKLDFYFSRAKALLDKACGIAEDDFRHAEGLFDRIYQKFTVFVSASLPGNSIEEETYGITNSDLAVSYQLFEKLTKKSLQLSLTVIEELVFSRTVNEHDFDLFPEAVKKKEALRKKIDSSDPLSPDDVKVLVDHGVAYSVEAYRELFLPELYLSIIYSYGRNFFYKNRATIEQPSFYIDLLKLAYCLSREISKRMDPKAVLHEYLVQSNALLYLLVNNDYVCRDDDTCIKKEELVHAEDLVNAINLYQLLLHDQRNFFEMGMLKKTKDDRYSKLVCHQQILKCYNSLLSLKNIEGRDQYIQDGARHCNSLLKMFRAQDVDRDDLVRYSRHLNAIAKFYLSINREEYYSQAIKIFTLSAEHAEKYDLVLFYVEAVVGLAEVFSRIGKHRLSATRVSIRHLKQCNFKESFREIQRQKPHIQEQIHNIQKQNLANVVTHCAQLRTIEQDRVITTRYFDDFDACSMDSASSISSTNAEICEDGLGPNGQLTKSQEHVVNEKNPLIPTLPENSSQDHVNAARVCPTPQDNAMDKHLLKLAQNIPGDWKELAIFLNVGNNKIIEISQNYPNNVVWQAYLMLKYWWTSHDKEAQSWREQLRKALNEIERNILARDFTGDVLQTDT